MNITSIFGIIPLAILAWFAISLTLFIRCPDEEADRKKNLKIMLIISAIIFGLMLISIGALIIVFSFAIANM